MNKKNYILLVCVAAMSLASCVDLTYTEANTKDEKWTYDSPLLGVKSLVWDIYSEVPDKLMSSIGGATLASASDEAEYATSISAVQYYHNGAWNPANSFNTTWITAYRAIAKVHMYLERIHKINLDEYKYGAEYENMVQQFEVFPYELRFLRAYFYFELARTYGDVPLVTTTLSNAQANSIHRTPAADIFDFIISECDAVAPYLPVSYMEMPGQEVGRAKRAAALALKARAALYAASPLFNPSGDKKLWKRAAEASEDLIKLAPAWGINLSAYKDLWGHGAFFNSEIIFGIGSDNSTFFERLNFPIGVENGQSGNCPTQTLVDAYEYADNGQTFGERNKGTITIDATTDPYKGLDPRFALTIVKNGDTWPLNSVQALTMQTYVGGFNGLPKPSGTPTGYYLRKFVDGNCRTTYNAASGQRHTWIVFRLGEFYLNYAEAIYNATGSADDAGGLSMTANEAVNVLRNRSDIKMPNFVGTADFAERYERERMVELAFEEHRFWDVRRWKKGSNFANVQKATLTLVDKDKNIVSLTRGPITRVWDDKYYLHPIATSELHKNPNLGPQNPGW